MPISTFYAGLRAKLGNELLLMPAVAAVIHDARGHVLIQGRRDGRFSLPAGAVEPGETPAQAVAREVYEETGLTTRPVALLGVFGGSQYRERYPNGDEVEYLVCLFRCEVVSGDLGPIDGESMTLRFHPSEALPSLPTNYPQSLLLPGAAGGSFQWTDDWLVGG